MVARAASIRTVATALVVLPIAAGGCADILGLDDPAGRLGDGGGGAASGPGTGVASTGADVGTGTGAGQGGGGPGGGGGSSTGTGSSTGAGGGPIEPGALELPASFDIHALGASDDGALALVRWNGNVDGALCGAPVPAQRLAAVRIEGSACELLTTISGENPLGFAIEQRGPWLGLLSSDLAGTITIHTPTPPMVVETMVGGAGVYGLWNAETDEPGFILGTAAPLVGGHLGPRADGSALIVTNATRFGFDPDLTPGPCEVGLDGAVAVHFGEIHRRPADCTLPRSAIEGRLLDVTRSDPPWALVVSAGNCSMVPDDTGASRPFGSCDGEAHLHVEPGSSHGYLGATTSGPCNQEAGLIANFTGPADPMWCEAADGPTLSVIPFLVDATHVHFVRVTDDGAELWKVRLADREAEPPRPLCTSCDIGDATTSNGTVYLTGEARASTEVLGEPIAEGSHFWAWIPVSEL